MKRLFLFILVFMIMAVLAAPVAANNGNGNGRGNSGDGSGTVWNKKKCEDAGGYWFNERGVKSCNFITEEEYDGPDVFESDPDEDIRSFLANLDTGEIIVFVVMYQQRGNVGAPGTADTFASSLTCQKLGVEGLFPDNVCDFLQREYGIDRNPLDL
jgi:hypothetical protein